MSGPLPRCPFCRRVGALSPLGWATCADCALECTVTKWREFAEHRAKAEAFDAAIKAADDAGPATPTNAFSLVVFLRQVLAKARAKGGLT